MKPVEGDVLALENPRIHLIGTGDVETKMIAVEFLEGEIEGTGAQFSDFRCDYDAALRFVARKYLESDEDFEAELTRYVWVD